MADYLMVHDDAEFGRLRPVLAEIYARRSFQGCETHLSAWRDTALRYTRAYHIDPGDLFLFAFVPGTRFTAAAWRALVGELLVVTSSEMPELPGHLESLSQFLSPVLARHALEGCADLTFGLATYRPGRAGFNSVEANRQLLDELRGVDPSRWTTSMLLSADRDADDAPEELLDVLDWFAFVLDLYERVVREDRVIVFENVHG